jgi:hypothetical protein
MKNTDQYYELEVRNRRKHKLDALFEPYNCFLKAARIYESWIRLEDDLFKAFKSIRKKR